MKRGLRTACERTTQASAKPAFDALAKSTDIAAGTERSMSVVPSHASRVKALKAAYKQVQAEVAGLAVQLPPLRVQKSMPVIGAQAAALIIMVVGDFSAFTTSGHSSPVTGSAPVTRGAGTSVGGDFASQAGDRRLQNSLFRSAWVASCHDPLTKSVYDRKWAEGKHDRES